MYHIHTVPEKNRIYFKLGCMGTGEGMDFYDEIQQETKKLTAGFTAVSDISAFFITDPREGIWADKIIQHLAEAGMKRVARVTGKKSKLAEKFEKPGYTVVAVETIEEADDYLDNA